jgi:hypothetical protein
MAESRPQVCVRGDFRTIAQATVGGEGAGPELDDTGPDPALRVQAGANQPHAGPAPQREQLARPPEAAECTTPAAPGAAGPDVGTWRSPVRASWPSRSRRTT